MASSEVEDASQQHLTLRVGCALLPKKVRHDVVPTSAPLSCPKLLLRHCIMGRAQYPVVVQMHGCTLPFGVGRLSLATCKIAALYQTDHATCYTSGTQVSRYLTPRMEQVAATKGLELVVIDTKRPLSEQGPFDAIIHKQQPSKGMCISLPLPFAPMQPQIQAAPPRVVMMLTWRGRGFVFQPASGSLTTWPRRSCCLHRMGK